MPSVGVRAQRGAAVRAVHAELSEQYLTCTKPISRPVATEPPVRRLLFSTCVYGDWTGPASATLIGVGRPAREAAREIAGLLGTRPEFTVP